MSAFLAAGRDTWGVWAFILLCLIVALAMLTGSHRGRLTPRDDANDLTAPCCCGEVVPGAIGSATCRCLPAAIDVGHCGDRHHPRAGAWCCRYIDDGDDTA